MTSFGSYYDGKFQKERSFYGKNGALRKVLYDASFEKEKDSAYRAALFTDGKNWALEGHSLEEATEELRANQSFCNGYKSIIHRKELPKKVYEFGRQQYLGGLLWENIPIIYRKNMDYMNGFKDAVLDDITALTKIQMTNLDKDDFEIGRRWALKGRKLDIATDSLRNNSSFCNGYEYTIRYNRLLNILPKLGYEHYLSGGTREDMPDIYGIYSAFIEGFNLAESDEKQAIQNNTRTRR